MPRVNAGTASIAVRARDENTAQVTREVARQLRGMKDRTREVNAQLRTLNRLGRTTRNVLGGLGLLAVTGRLRNFAGEAASLGASLVESANTAGLSVEQFQILQRTFEGNGVSAAQFRIGMTTLQRRLIDLQRNLPTVVDAFGRLSLSWTDLRGLNVDQIIGRVADGMQGLSSQTERVAVATQLFGRSGADFVTTLQGGNAELREQARQFSFFDNVTTEAAVTLKALEQTFTDTARAIQTGFAEAIAQLAPQFTSLSESITELARRLPEVVARSQEAGFNLTTFFGQIAVGAGTLSLMRRGLVLTQRILRGFQTAIRSGTSPLFALGRQIGLLAARFTLFAAPVALVVTLFTGWRESQRRLNEEMLENITNVSQLEIRLRELQNRLTGAAAVTDIFGRQTRLLNLTQSQLRDLREYERIVERLAELTRVPFGPPVPGTEGVLTNEQVAEREREEANRRNEEAQKRINEFVQQRVGFYRQIATLQQRIPTVPTIQQQPMVELSGADQQFRDQVQRDIDLQSGRLRVVTAIADIQAGASQAVARAAEAQGGLTQETQRYRQILASVQNDRFVESQLIDAGVRQAERQLDAQVRAGEITRETADASLIVNRRIAQLTLERATATGSERDNIENILADLESRYPEIVAEIAGALNGLTEDLSFQAQALQTTFQSIGRGLERGILRAVREGGNLLDIFKRIGQEILGTVLSNLTRLAVGSLFSAIGLPGFQYGGVTRPNSFNVVGEAGPEIIYTERATRVVPTNQIGGGGAVINIDARGGDEASVSRAIQRFLPLIAESVNAQTINDVRFATNNPSPMFRRNEA